MSRPLQALVAIQYDDGETHFWRLNDRVTVEEDFNMVLVGPDAGPPFFNLVVRGHGRRDDVEPAIHTNLPLIISGLNP
jgi:hypothetical protein